MMPRFAAGKIAILALIQAFSVAGLAQERTASVQVRVRPDRSDWTYELGQNARFEITAIQDGHPIKGIEIAYQIGPEMMPAAVRRSEKLQAESIVADGGTMKQPGFLRCIATVTIGGKSYRGLATAGFRPDQIAPTTTDPSDFDTFWQAGKEELAKIPIDAQLTPLPDYGNAKVDAFHVSFQNVGGSRIYGILCVPKGDGPFPAVLNVPGAGVRPYRGLLSLAEKGIITLQIGIHGIPVNLPQELYDGLRVAALNGYQTFNLDNRDRYFYRRVYLGCVRSNDFLTSLPKWNGRDLAVTGGSQGGALSIVTAALDPRVKGLAASYPALSDLTGYVEGRAGGWPHMFRSTGSDGNRTKEKIETSRYYDVVNFARRIKATGLYVWGFNDETCPPTSMYSAYNVITAPKRLLLALETGHNTIPEETEVINRWLEALVSGGH